MANHSRRDTLFAAVALVASSMSSKVATAQSAAPFRPYGLGLRFAPVDQTRSSRDAEYNGKSLPKKADVLRFVPTIGDQGYQGSCVGWATAYAAMTSIARRKNPNAPPFSAAFVYNRGMLLDLSAADDWPHCGQGMMIETALSLIQGFGLLAGNDFPYDWRVCRRLPTWTEDRRAEKNLIADWALAHDDRAVKQSIAQGVPAIVGMRVGEKFMRHSGSSVFAGESSYDGGHAMAIVGYDDSLQAWKLMNSWGTGWGDSGFCWISYDALKAATTEQGVPRLFVLYPAK